MAHTDPAPTGGPPDGPEFRLEPFIRQIEILLMILLPERGEGIMPDDGRTFERFVAEAVAEAIRDAYLVTPRHATN